MLIVAGSPAAQLPQAGGQQRIAIQQFSGVLEFVARHIGLLGDAGNQTDHLTVAERHADPQADLQVIRADAGWRTVIE